MRLTRRGETVAAWALALALIALPGLASMLGYWLTGVAE